VNISKTVADTAKVTIMTNRKSHMGFPLTPRSITLDNLELTNYLGISRHFSVSDAITAKRMKIDPYCQQRNCSPLNVLFSDV